MNDHVTFGVTRLRWGSSKRKHGRRGKVKPFPVAAGERILVTSMGLAPIKKIACAVRAGLPGARARKRKRIVEPSDF